MQMAYRAAGTTLRRLLRAAGTPSLGADNPSAALTARLSTLRQGLQQDPDDQPLVLLMELRCAVPNCAFTRDGAADMIEEVRMNGAEAEAGGPAGPLLGV